MCHCWFWLQAGDPCLWSFPETRRLTQSSKEEGKEEQRSRLFFLSLINSGSFAPWAFGLSQPQQLVGVLTGVRAEAGLQGTPGDSTGEKEVPLRQE